MAFTPVTEEKKYLMECRSPVLRRSQVNLWRNSCQVDDKRGRAACGHLVINKSLQLLTPSCLRVGGKGVGEK